MEWLNSWRDSWTDDSTTADPFVAQSDEIELDDAREQPDEQDDLLPLPPGLKRRAPGESSASLPEFEPRRTGRKRRPSTAFDDYETTSPPSSPVKPAAEKRSLAAKPPSANPKRQRPNAPPTPPRSNGSRDTRAARSLSSGTSGSASSSDPLPTNGAARANQAAARSTANGRLEATDRAPGSKPMSRNGQAWTAEEDSRLYAAVTEHRQENSDRFPADIWQFAPGDDPTWIAIHARFIATGEKSARAERTQYALRGRWKNIRLRELAAQPIKGASSSTLDLNKHATGSAAEGVEADPSVARQTPEAPLSPDLVPELVEPVSPAESRGTKATQDSEDAQHGAVTVAEQDMIDLESTAAKQQNEIFSSLLSDEGMAAMSAPDTPEPSDSSGRGTEMQSVDTTSMMMESPPSSIADSSPSGSAEIPLSLDMSSTATCTTATRADEALGHRTGTTPVSAPETRAFPDGLPPFVVASFGRLDPKDKYCGPLPVVPDRDNDTAQVGVDEASRQSEEGVHLPRSTSSASGTIAPTAQSYADNPLFAQPLPSQGSERAAGSGDRRHLWKPEEDAKLVELLSRKQTHAQIGVAIGRPSAAITKRVGRLRGTGMLPPAGTPISTSTESPTPPPTSDKATPDTTSTAETGAEVAAPSSSSSAPATEGRAPASNRYSADDDAVLTQLRSAGLSFADIAKRLLRSQASCRARYVLLREKAALAGTPLPMPVLPAPKPKTTAKPTTPTTKTATDTPESASNAMAVAPQIGVSTNPAVTVGVATVPAAAGLPAPLPPYTAQDDGIILRMYLQGASAESIALALRRSVKSVQRRWTKKKAEWIPQGLVSSSTHLKAKEPVASGSTRYARPNLPAPGEATATVDPFADLRSPTGSTRDVLSVSEAPVETDSSKQNVDEELANNFGGFDGSFYAYEGALNVEDAPAGQGDSLAAAAASGLDQTGMTESAAGKISNGAEESYAFGASEMARDESRARTIEADPFMARFETGMRGLNRFMQLMRR